MMKTAIVADSNCGISKSEADNLGLYIVPMPVCINNTFYYEGVNLDQKDFFTHLANHEKIHTSQPSPADLLTMWERVFEEGYDELVYIPMSSGLSGSFHTACRMAEEFPGKVHKDFLPSVLFPAFLMYFTISAQKPIPLLARLCYTGCWVRCKMKMGRLPRKQLIFRVPQSYYALLGC